MKFIALTATAIALAIAAPACAQDFAPKAKGTWIVAGRLTGVTPDASGSIVTAAGADTGLDVDVGEDWKPTLGFTYFFTDHVAVEAILGTTRHEISAKGAGGSTDVHETWVLPPVVTLQYHFRPQARVSPYVGAGVNAMIFYGGDDKNGFTVDVDNGFGGALQAGVDIALKDAWSLNIDAKKVFFETDASINKGALKSDVTLDPWVVSVGVARRF
jgi:outer membrane protein